MRIYLCIILFRKELEKIREDIQNAKQRLAEVDKEAEMLEQIIAK